MTPDTENFDALRRLLKLKRGEQPPPDYFHDFSRQVMARVKAGAKEERDHPIERLFWEAPWLQRLIEAFQAKPALAVAFGAAVCAMLIGGVIFSETTDVAPVTLLTAPQDPTRPAITPATSPAFALSQPGGGTAPANNTNNSMNLIIQPGGSLFDQVRINPQPVGFQLQGNNGN